MEYGMQIVNFSSSHIPQAMALALAQYEEEREQTAGLPPIAHTPDLREFVRSAPGVAAVEGEQLVGFLCGNPPRENAFHAAARGIFSPIHAHGAVRQNRADIYARLYQAAAAQWVRAGIAYHSIGLYAHDSAAISAFFSNGFGRRCIDAVRPMTSIGAAPVPGITFRELRTEEFPGIRLLQQGLADHLAASPCFMQHSPEPAAPAEAGVRIFAAFRGHRPLAFLELADEAETFITHRPDMKNIVGAYCLPDERGTGIYPALLDHALIQLAGEGYAYMGVDFESFNPIAAHFWPKHFAVYTNGLVRRIDECALHPSG